MPYSLLHSNITRIFRAGASTKLPFGVLFLWDEPKKEEIIGDMLEFTTWGLAGRNDHGPQAGAGKARKAKPPSKPDEEEAKFESGEEGGDEVGGDSSGSKGEDNDNDDDDNETVTDADDDDEEDDEEEEEE